MLLAVSLLAFGYAARDGIPERTLEFSSLLGDTGSLEDMVGAIYLPVGGRVWGVWFPRWCLALCAGAPLRCCSGACFLAFDET